MVNVVTQSARVKSTKPTTTRVLRYNADTHELTIVITTGRRVLETSYSLTPVCSDWGDGFALTKHVGHPADQCETYHVHLSDQGHTCDCPHATYRPNTQPCKHIASVVKLRDLGQL